PRPGLLFTDEFLPEWPLLLKAALLKATLEQPTERVNARTFRNLLQGCLPSTHTALKLRDEKVLTNPGDFVQLANQDWRYALQLIQEESFQAWMETAFEREHRKLNFSALREKLSAPNTFLEAFLQHIDPDLSKPQLAVEPDSIARVDLHLSTKMSTLSLKNITRGYLPAQLRSSVPWVEIEPPKLVLIGKSEQSVNLVIDPEKIPGWTGNLTGEINILTPSHTISVPIKVRRSLFCAALQRIIHPALRLLRTPSAAVGSLFLSFISMWNYINWAFGEFPQKSDLPINLTLGFLPAVGMLSSMIGYWLGSSGAVPDSIKKFPKTVGHIFGAGLLLGGGIFGVNLANQLLEFGQVNSNVYYYSVTCAAIILAILYYAYQRDKINTSSKVRVFDIIKMPLGALFAVVLTLGFILSAWNFSLADLYQQKPLIPLIVDAVH
ncbi:MAG: DUF5717 family protein, partial [Anaerolineaceae bacterium]|nr:DUF5717 family protein [Anaerolineaceae bacterium]